VLSDLGRPGHALAARSYSVRLGTTATISVPLTRAAIKELLHSRRVLVQTVERGHSKLGPRRAEFELAIAR
jgi:DNA primase